MNPRTQGFFCGLVKSCRVRITLVLTQDCNLRCDYCYTGEKVARVMPDRVAWLALHLLFRQSMSGSKVQLGFFGGEPLLEFARMARYTRLTQKLASRKGLEVEFQLTTNATLVNLDILKFFRHYPFRVAFSVDGLGETHDRHRPFASGRPSSAAVWRNLELAAAHLAHPSIQMVVNPDTLSGLTATIKRLLELGYRKVSLLPNMEAQWNERERREARAAYCEVACLLAKSERAEVRPLARERQRPCGFGDQDVAVSPSGALYPCARLVGGDHRESIHLGHVSSGLDARKVKVLKSRAQAKENACGLGGGCQCQTFLPGDLVRQVRNLRFFSRLGAEVRL